MPRKEDMFPLIMIVLAIIGFIDSYAYGGQAGVWPRWLWGSLALLNGLLLLGNRQVRLGPLLRRCVTYREEVP